MIKAIIAVVIGAVLLVVVMTNIEKTTSGEDSSGGGSEVIDDKYTVSIEGQVNKEGTYYLATNSTLNDLVNAAGGLTSNADDRSFELNYLLKNNLTFYIAPKYDTSETCVEVEITKYCVNTASSEDLMKINGVSASIATSIISYRDGGGTFHSLEELKNVKGIGSATYSKMRNFVTLR